MITSQGLQKLGFKSLISNEDGDFLLEDAGAGTYIAQWKSASPQPTESEIETAHATWQTAYDANETAKTSGRDKLVALGLTTSELDALGIE